MYVDFSSIIRDREMISDKRSIQKIYISKKMEKNIVNMNKEKKNK